MEKERMQIDKGEISLARVGVILVVIIGFLWGCVQTIILPINSMQVQLAQIQVTLKTQSQTFTTLQAQVTSNSNDILILKAQQTSSQTTINNK